MDLGWKKKAERLRMIVLTGAHSLAKELAPALREILDFFRETAKTLHFDRAKAARTLAAPIAQEVKPIWEPAEIYGWKIEATLYREQHQLWWLVSARRGEHEQQPPTEKSIDFLIKVLEHLGADPRRDAIIAPWSHPEGKEALPFGWWAWINQQPLYEFRVKGKSMRVFPLDAPEVDGYTRLDQADRGC